MIRINLTTASLSSLMILILNAASLTHGRHQHHHHGGQVAYHTLPQSSEKSKFTITLPGSQKIDLDSLLKDQVVPGWNVPHKAQEKFHNWLLNKASGIKVQNVIMEKMKESKNAGVENLMEMALQYYNSNGDHFLRPM